MIFIASRWFSIGFSIGFNKVSWFHMIPKSEKTILLDLGFSFPWVSYGPWSAEVAMIAGCVTELGTLNSRVDSSAGHGGGWWWWFDGRCHCCHCSPRTAYIHSVAFKAWKSSNNALLFCIHIYFLLRKSWQLWVVEVVSPNEWHMDDMWTWLTSMMALPTANHQDECKEASMRFPGQCDPESLAFLALRGDPSYHPYENTNISGWWFEPLWKY